MKPTGHSVRGPSSSMFASVDNTFIVPGNITLEDKIKTIKKGLLITELIGFGVDIVNGDYSQGAFGFLITDGKIVGAVSEITVAGNMLDMLKNAEPCSDLIIQYGIDSPSIYFGNMSVGSAV